MPLTFDNRFVQELPGEEQELNRPRQVYGACWSPVSPTPVSQPTVVVHSTEMARAVGLEAADFEKVEVVDALSGNGLLPGMKSYSFCYGGHQFGNWAGQLGDGRAINLGEVLGDRGRRWVLQLKGAGPTPYSRRGDGRAVLRSSIREFVCSEAMHHLGVPTTRALSLATTGDEVIRDMFYDGRPAPEAGAIVCRVSPSFVRFGSFEIFTSRGEDGILKQLTDFVIDRDFPHIESTGEKRVLEFFSEVCRLTAVMVSHWMRVGYVHGVMNTDNMSILGLTIDYGPYGWIDDYDPNWTPNTTDLPLRRYRFGHQPRVAQWNLLRLAHALAPLLVEPQNLEEGFERFASVYESTSMAMTYEKFGLPGDRDGEDDELMAVAYKLLQECEVDMTLFFRGLASPDLKLSDLEAAFYDREKIGSKKDEWERWLGRYRDRVRGLGSQVERLQRMNLVNPLYVPRNYLLQEAIEKAESGDYSRLHDLVELFRNPYSEQEGKEHFSSRRPDWARSKPGCSMLSCSS